LGEAGIDANNSFGTLIWEQEGHTQNKRYDDIRVGDVIVLHDAKLKGKKGLVPYNQQVGSVEEPMFAICSETEQKKNKVKVWQVDRGVSGLFPRLRGVMHLIVDSNIAYRIGELPS